MIIYEGGGIDTYHAMVLNHDSNRCGSSCGITDHDVAEEQTAASD